MALFHSKLLVYQRANQLINHKLSRLDLLLSPRLRSKSSKSESHGFRDPPKEAPSMNAYDWDYTFRKWGNEVTTVATDL